MKVLLLGATGNVGSRLIPALLSHNHTVAAYVRSASKLPTTITPHLAAVIEGSGTDAAAIKAAILKENCDALINCAGVAAMTSWNKPSQLPLIVDAVVKAAVEAGRERGRVLRCWFMSGWSVLDIPGNAGGKAGTQIVKYLPLYPEHITNYALLQTHPPTTDLAWSLFCANLLTPRHTPPAYPHPADATAANLMIGAECPPGWKNTLRWLPLLGPLLNIMINAPGYGTPLEDCVDFLAADLESGLGSEWVGKRVGVKVKAKAA